MNKRYLIVILIIVIILGYFFFKILNKNGEIAINNKGQLVEIKNGKELVLTGTNAQVKFFDISPNGKYIAYTVSEGFESCCGGIDNIPKDWVWIVERNGDNNSRVEAPTSDELDGRNLIRYNGWYPDSSGIMVYFQYPDESMQGSGIYKVDTNGKNPTLDLAKRLPFR